MWVANSRETTHTKGHRKYSDLDMEYWNFTSYEMAMNDNPAFVDYILNHTGKSQVNWVGHSQGTVTFFLASAVLENSFTNKIKRFVGLSPILYVDHAGNGFSLVLDGLDFVNTMSELTPNFLYYSPFFSDIFAPAFVDYFPRYSFELLQMLVGHNEKGRKVPLNRIGMMARFDTGGCSSKNFRCFN